MTPDKPLRRTFEPAPIFITATKNVRRLQHY